MTFTVKFSGTAGAAVAAVVCLPLHIAARINRSKPKTLFPCKRTAQILTKLHGKEKKEENTAENRLKI